MMDMVEQIERISSEGKLKTTSLIEVAISDDLRTKILKRLKVTPASITDLAKEFKLSKPLIYYHIKILANANLITIIGYGKSPRGPMKKYYGLSLTGEKVVNNLLMNNRGQYKSIPMLFLQLVINNDPYFYNHYKRVLKYVSISLPILLLTYLVMANNIISALIEVILTTAGVFLALNLVFLLLSRSEAFKRRFIYKI